jgi:hypothetical protein
MVLLLLDARSSSLTSIPQIYRDLILVVLSTLQIFRDLTFPFWLGVVILKHLHLSCHHVCLRHNMGRTAVCCWVGVGGIAKTTTAPSARDRSTSPPLSIG